MASDEAERLYQIYRAGVEKGGNDAEDALMNAEEAAVDGNITDDQFRTLVLLHQSLTGGHDLYANVLDKAQ